MSSLFVTGRMTHSADVCDYRIRLSDIRVNEVVALVEKAQVVRLGGGVGEAIPEIQIGLVTGHLAIAPHGI